MGEDKVGSTPVSRKHLVWAAALLAVAVSPSGARGALRLPRLAPEAAGVRAAGLAGIDAAIDAAIKGKEVPGAVVLVARRGGVVYFKAFGNRAVAPDSEPMTTDTIFDMASLTKVMATAPSVLLLAEQGLVRLGDRVSRYLPLFKGNGKDAITVRQLLIHYSGLRPDFDLSKSWEGRDAALGELWQEKTQSEPGKEFVYSDLNFIALGEIVRAAAGKPLEDFARENIYGPLRMSETRFNPPAEWRARIAPTEPRARSLAYLKGKGSPEQAVAVLRGEVHDPTAWRMGGVAGHAGLFSTAADVATYAQMLLNRGSFAGRRVFSPLGIRAMTSPQSPRGALPMRGLGWDIETSFSSPRGDLFGGGFGHTGFTGTSLWVHPATETFVVILSNRVHPDGKGDATRLRGVVANIVAAAITDIGQK